MSLLKKGSAVNLKQLNAMTLEKWNESFMDIVEKSPEFARKTWASTPYSSINDLEKVFFDALDNLSLQDKIKIISRHKDSVQEVFHRFITYKTDINSGSLIRFLDISQFESQLCTGIYLLKAYEKYFGFPFVMKPTDIDFESFYFALQHRCNNTFEQEINIAVDEIKKYVREKLRSVILNPS